MTNLSLSDLQQQIQNEITVNDGEAYQGCKITIKKELPDSKSIAEALMARKVMFLHTYHCDDKPIMITPFGKGFPDIGDSQPVQCPFCDAIVDNLDQLKFSVWGEETD